MKRPVTMTWNGYKFTPTWMSGAGTCWVSVAVGVYGKPIWKARQWGPDAVWRARLRLGVYMFPGEGKTAAEALTAALEEGRRVAGLLQDVGCGAD